MNTQRFSKEEIVNIYTTRASTYKMFLDEYIKSSEPEVYAKCNTRAKELWKAIVQKKSLNKKKIRPANHNSTCESCKSTFYSATKTKHCSLICELYTKPLSLTTCKACYDGTDNEEAHMSTGGCMFREPSTKEEVPELPPLPPSPSYFRLSPIHIDS